MAKARICECGHHNQPKDLLCFECGEDLSRKPLVDESTLEAEAENAASAVSEIEAESRPAPSAEIHGPQVVETILRLLTEGGLEIAKAHDGAIVGRAEVGSDYLQNFPTVSRKHIQVFRRNGTWWLKNLSDNGTWLNGQEVPQNEERETNLGDELKLSTKCRLMVM